MVAATVPDAEQWAGLTQKRGDISGAPFEAKDVRLAAAFPTRRYNAR